VIAFCGGAAKSLLRRNPNTRWLDVFAQAFASGFTGFIVGTALLRWLGSTYIDLVLSLVGLAGWIGPSLMDYLATVTLAMVREKFNLPPLGGKEEK
jgi:hypothetical protein